MFGPDLAGEKILEIQKAVALFDLLSIIVDGGVREGGKNNRRSAMTRLIGRIRWGFLPL